MRRVVSLKYIEMMMPKKRLICGMGRLFSQGFELLEGQTLDLQIKAVRVEVEHFVPDEGVRFEVNFYLKKQVAFVPLPKNAAPGQVRHVGHAFRAVVVMKVEFVFGSGLDGEEVWEHGEWILLTNLD
jgi:hypothetical protein